MTEAPKKRRKSALPITIALLVTGLIGAGYVEFLGDPVVDRTPHSVSDSNQLHMTFVTARSRLLHRAFSRLIMIEGKGAVRDHHAWIWGHSPEGWLRTECVLLSDAVGVRPGSPAVFRELWKFAGTSGQRPYGLLRQVAEETRDKDLRSFLASNRP